MTAFGGTKGPLRFGRKATLYVVRTRHAPRRDVVCCLDLERAIQVCSVLNERAGRQIYDVEERALEAYQGRLEDDDEP